MEPFKNNELMFSQMVEASSNAMILVDENGNIVYLNSYAEQLSQYSKEELIGKNLDVFIPKEYMSTYPSLIQAYIENPVRRRMGENKELNVLRKDRTEIPVEVGVNPIVTDDGNMVLATIIDITPRKNAEFESNLLVESVPNPIILINSDGEIIRSNKQAERQFGYDKEELIGKKMEILVPERFRNKHVSLRDMFIHNPDMRAMGAGRDLVAVRKNGEEFPAEIGLNPVTTKDGVFVLASIIDISERRKLEDKIAEDARQIEKQNEELKVSEQKLKELNATKDKFFSILAHDLKNPFNIILGYSDMLSEEYEELDDSERKQFISEINKSTKTTFSLLESLLTWARSQQGNIEIVKEEQNLCELVEQAVAPYTPNSRKKNIDIEIDIPKDQLLFADKYTMSIVIGNLVNNAIKFTPDGGCINISRNLNSNHIELLIRDNGVGMTDEQKNKIFKIEENSSTLGTNNEKGTGLGLILCKEFVEKNGGDIRVESEIDKGSVFIITLPINNNSDDN